MQHFAAICSKEIPRSVSYLVMHRGFVVQSGSVSIKPRLHSLNVSPLENANFNTISNAILRDCFIEFYFSESREASRTIQ